MEKTPTEYRYQVVARQDIQSAIKRAHNYGILTGIVLTLTAAAIVRMVQQLGFIHSGLVVVIVTTVMALVFRSLGRES